MAEQAKKGGASKAAAPSKEEVELRKKLNELEKENKNLKEVKAQAESTPKEDKGLENPEILATIKNLQAEIEGLKSRGPSTVVVDPSTKPKYKPVEPGDWQDETVIFTARSVLYVVGSYKNSKGIDVLPPHKPIVFEYAASDIRKEGNEEHILNYCQFQTNLRTEIEYLRHHPHNGITFSENMNKIMDEDITETQYKVRAASMVNAMGSQAVFERARNYGIPYHGMEMNELKMRIIHKLSEDFIKQSKDIESNRLKRMAVGNMAFQNK